MGSSVVPDIVQQSGGYIVVPSLPDVRTTFKIYLPAVGELALQPLQNASVKPVRGEIILLVEDEASIRKMTALLLKRLGYRERPRVIQSARGQ
jgi:two-component system cell cycle sensor histidine kinase/response regulator CckA